MQCIGTQQMTAHRILEQFLTVNNNMRCLNKNKVIWHKTFDLVNGLCVHSYTTFSLHP